MLRTSIASMIVAEVSGHGAMSFPKPRNSGDGALAPWSDWAFPCDDAHQGPNCTITFCETGKNCQGSCPISAHNGEEKALNASNGQACYWFSNGCTIGCDECDGTHNHVGHGFQSFLFQGMTGAELRKKNVTLENPWNPTAGDMVLNPASATHLNISANCANPINATICDSRLRTANTQAECGSAADFYFFSPWRAPGSAPVLDACGAAGGRFPGQGTGGAGAQFQNSSFAQEGDLGSKLPPLPSGTIWQAGSHVEVGWTVMANHGGGYRFALAPANKPLTEKLFQEMPLDFVGDSVLRWDGNVSTQLAFDPLAKGWQTNVGTVPKGSMWRKNPIPSGLWEREGPGYEPVCEESEACKRWATGYGGKAGVCRCSGYSNGGPLLPNLEVVDTVVIPADITPGDYVLQWRWDCEESDQVWASCSDVTIEAGN